MTFPDLDLQRPAAHPDNRQDVIPLTERNEDPERDEIEHDLTSEVARPLTDEEKNAADRDVPAGQRVYAPASERVPKEPVPGHREFVEHPDTHTPEREAIAMETTSTTTNHSDEPAFTRVSRPSETETPGAYGAPSTWNTGADTSTWNGGQQRGRLLGMGMGWVTLGVSSGVGLWLWMRWRRERNKPINRLRRQARQARQAADELRERVPDEAVRPAMGLTTAVVSIALILWQQAQARSHRADQEVTQRATSAARRAGKNARHAAEAASEVDWQKRLTKLRDRWNPGRLELEKVSISRHK